MKANSVHSEESSGVLPRVCLLPAFWEQGMRFGGGGQSWSSNSVALMCHHGDSCQRGKSVTSLTEVLRGHTRKNGEF
jgi:hypothetical protein